VDVQSNLPSERQASAIGAIWTDRQLIDGGQGSSHAGFADEVHSTGDSLTSSDRCPRWTSPVGCLALPRRPSFAVRNLHLPRSMLGEFPVNLDRCIEEIHEAYVPPIHVFPMPARGSPACR
jgi:hypothetical protein